ncbi:MAG: hypothetical protein JNM30_05340 [Rhodospirillales bacterium]|nr:hypothetical protein [Rhodospirillales bacterium]
MFDNELDRLRAVANVAKVLVQLTEQSVASDSGIDAEAISLGKAIVRSLVLLDLSPPATAADDTAQLERVTQIRVLIERWQELLGEGQR